MTHPISRAQMGEDIILLNYFGSHKGSFMEIGAADGMKFSNCRLLMEAGWTGVFIEPHPELFMRLLNNCRGYNAQCLCCCVMSKREIRTLHMNSDLLSTTDPQAFERAGANCFNGWCHTPALTPDEIADKYGTNFDLVSIDCEGGDLDIINSGHRLLSGVRVLCVERYPSCAREVGNPELDYEKRVIEAASGAGFQNIIHRTHCNLIFARA